MFAEPQNVGNSAGPSMLRPSESASFQIEGTVVRSREACRASSRCLTPFQMGVGNRQTLHTALRGTMPFPRFENALRRLPPKNYLPPSFHLYNWLRPLMPIPDHIRRPQEGHQWHPEPPAPEPAVAERVEASRGRRMLETLNCHPQRVLAQNLLFLQTVI